MNSSDFFEPFEQLIQAFSVQKAVEKRKIYFLKLERLSNECFIKTCNYALEHCDRFPTISYLLEIARTFPDNYTSFVCKECSGEGLLSKWNHAFRCRCLNGERISKLIPLVPFTFEEKKEMYTRLNQEWRKMHDFDLPKEWKVKEKAVVDMDIIEKTKREFGLM